MWVFRKDLYQEFRRNDGIEKESRDGKEGVFFRDNDDETLNLKTMKLRSTLLHEVNFPLRELEYTEVLDRCKQWTLQIYQEYGSHRKDRINDNKLEVFDN